MTIRHLALTGLLLVLCSTALAHEHPISLSEKASLQAAIQKHIDRTMVDGRYLHLDVKSGEVQGLRPLAAHPVIFRMGEYFVLCADFRGPDGDEVNIDDYLARKGRSFVVFDEQVENRALIKQLMKKGKLTRVD